MASVGSSDSKPRRSFRMDNKLIKPVLLKEYLLDDLSSCSSNGFKSFPRRQCCTTVRFLVDKDLKSRPAVPSRQRSRVVHKTRPKTAGSSAISAFQRASEAVLNAVKLLSVHNRSCVKSGFLARNFSRKVFKRKFWQKSVGGHGQIKDSEIHRWKTFHNLISEFPETPTHCVPTPPTTDSSSTGGQNSKSSSWSDNEFSSESTAHDADAVKQPEDRSGSGDSADAASNCLVAPVGKAEDWMGKDEKEQFSPVSVLESPFLAEEDGDGDDASSPDSDTKLVRMEETKKRLTQRLGGFEILREMEPVELDKRLAALSKSDGNETINLNAELAQKMLRLVKSRMAAPSETNPAFCLDNLLLDFFMDSFDDDGADHQVTEAAESYVTGQGKKMAFDWEVEENRKWYVKDMERGGIWKHVVNDDQRAELAMEIEGGIWRSLVNELMSELD